MSETERATGGSNIGLIKGLTFMMFMMFAMTTDSVGVIIPQIIKSFDLGMTAAGSFHYATMGGIALGALVPAGRWRGLVAAAARHRHLGRAVLFSIV